AGRLSSLARGAAARADAGAAGRGALSRARLQRLPWRQWRGAGGDAARAGPARPVWAGGALERWPNNTGGRALFARLHPAAEVGDRRGIRADHAVLLW